jgi:hypothetical protein
MDERRLPAETDAARRLRLEGRARRGLIADYIHELSERHSGAGGLGEEALEREGEPPRDG